MTRSKILGRALLASVACVAGGGASAQDWTPNYGLLGTPGLVEMPTAVSPPEAELGVSLSGFSLQQHVTFAFQITPRLQASFRYSHLDEWAGPGTDGEYQPSYDFQYRLVDETDFVPAVAIGIRDFFGSGRQNAEYVVATKTLTDDVRVTGGLGWGRLGSYNGFDNPLGLLSDSFLDRPSYGYAVNGVPATHQFFRGDAALFGGVEWHINPKLTFVAEYSSDAHSAETGVGSFEHNSPFNVGLVYAPSEDYRLGVFSLHGSEIAFGATALMNPNNRSAISGQEPAPIPVRVRPEDARAATTWNRVALTDNVLAMGVSQLLANEGVVLHAATFEDRSVRLRYTNTRYRSEAQAAGRIARLLTQSLPNSIEVFHLEPMQGGLPLSTITLRRSDIERLEGMPGATNEIYENAAISEASLATPGVELDTIDEPFQWGILPYASVSLFSGDDPAQFDLGIEIAAEFTIAPNLIVSGLVKQRLADNVAASGGGAGSLPAVRSDAAEYAATSTSLDHLTVSYVGRPAPELYSRVSVGYLERMFGGVSTELLWKPVNGNFALGAEVNYAVQRDFTSAFAFQDYDTVTGHLSAYWEFDSGVNLQVDAGRYLAGDWGATVSVDREFGNGWRVGAYATLTDVDFADYGDGAFDKGIRIVIPTDWVSGQATQRSVTMDIGGQSRDAGARLNVDGRLYQTVRGGHIDDLDDSWGRFWR